MNTYKNFQKGLAIVPKASTESNVKGEMEVLTSDSKLRFFNGTVNDPVVTETVTATLTNKTISGSTNTLINIANASLVHSSITINGTLANLGDSITISASTTNTLTIGTGLTGSSFNGSAPVTITIDSTVATLTGTQTLTNKTIAAGSNTITGLTNTNLSGSAAITNANLVTMAAHTYKGNNTGSGSTPIDVTSTQLTADLNVFTSTLKGLAPASAGGTDNFLRADGTFAPPPSGNLSVVSISANYSVLTSDGAIICNASSGAFTVTLPTAVGVSGKNYIIKRIDSALANTIVLAAASGEFIDGYPSKNISTGNESYTIYSDGTNWQIQDHNIDTSWTQYAPTLVGFGTVSGSSFIWRRIGQNLEIRGQFVAGTPTATIALVPFPSSALIVSALVSSILDAGKWVRQSGGGAIDKGGFMLYNNGSSNITFAAVETFGPSNTSTTLSAKNGNAIVATGETISLDATIPIDGWEG